MLQEGFKIRTVPAIEKFLKDLPEGVILLPDNWEGETTRAMLTFSVSHQAENNEKFDLDGFLKKKLCNALTAIRRRAKVEELRLTRRFHVVIDPIKHKNTQIYFHIEYANK